MASSVFPLEITTPTRSFFSGDVHMLIITTPTGKMGIMRHHTPMIVAVESDVIALTIGGSVKQASVTSGFLEITDEKVILLVDSAEWPEEIDVNRALEAKRRAEERLHFKTSEREYVQSKAALARAAARLRATRRGKT